GGAGRAGGGDRPDGRVVGGVPGARLDVVGVQDQAGRATEHLARQWELLWLRFPRWWDAPVQDAVRKQASRDAGVAFHCGQVARAVLPADRQPGNEVVEHEVVQDDHARPTPKSIPRESGAVPTW